jgi:hypothetical protein
MSESDGSGGDSKFMTGFFVGFIVGVLICLGVGGTFLVVTRQHRMVEMERAARDAEMAARRSAEALRALEDVRLREAKDDPAKPELLPEPKAEAKEQEKE